MKLTIEIKLESGESLTAVVIPADIIAWENYPKRNSRKMSELSAGIALGDLAFLAWASLKRKQSVSLDFDSWINEIAEIEVTDATDPK